jgi:cellulose synthase/poly-beta-1,6-N-acetylglucosamine synthase-like glycosyltransferase
MDFLTNIFLVYSFIAFFFLFLFLMLYFQNRKKINWVPPITKKYGLSIVIPCYNEEKSIGQTIENLINNGYSNLKKIIVVDDRSTDDSFNIMKKYEKKYPNFVKAVQTPENTGNAAGAKNYGASFVKTELIGFTDADSFPIEGSIEKTIGFFDDLNVGAVTSNVLVQNRNNFLLKIQAIEYIIIKFTRKLLEFVGSIYVTPGPLAIYRREYFEKVGKFDESNVTEDIEITWRFLYNGYDIKMSVPSKVYSIAPHKFRAWFKQRIRWNMGGIQCIFKYSKIFGRKGMLGVFVLPFFLFSWILGALGLVLILYRAIRTVIVRYLLTTYSVGAHTAILRLNDITFNPSFLVYMGTILLVLSVLYSLIALLSVKEKGFKRPRVFTFIVYEFFYLLMYPIILVTSAYKLSRGDVRWHK